MRVMAPTTALTAFVCAATCVAQDLDAQARAIVDGMSLDQLLGQMTQITIDFVAITQNGGKTLDITKVQELANQGVGSYLNSPFQSPLGDNYGWNVQEWRQAVSKLQDIHIRTGGTPIVYGLDSLHGANYVKGSVLFPHQINAGATFDPELARRMGQFTGRDTKAAGVNWIFGPCLEPARHKGWPRIMETFGEDPKVVSDMGKAMIEGIQSQGVAACFKHFIGYSASSSGKDRDPVSLTNHELLNLFMPPFKAAIDAGVMSGMDSFVALDGIPMAANRKNSIALLRNDLKFDGVLVSDWEEIYLLDFYHHYAANREDAVYKAMTDSSLDMSMVPYDTSFIGYMKTLYASGKIPLDRIKTSARRLVKLKLKLNLFNVPVPGADVVDQVGDWPSRAAAWDIAKESLVLVKNSNNILPLDKSKKFFFTGPSIDDIGLLCGGWSLTWQGQQGSSMFPNHWRTIKGAMSDVVNDPSRATFYQGVNTDGTWWDINLAKQKAQAADYTVIALGERTYAEFMGNTDPYELPTGLTDYVKAIASTGTKIILILVEGRPRNLNGIADVAHAVMYAGLPCEMGGEAISEMLFGFTNPSGKMPLTYPKTTDPVNMATPYYSRVDDNCVVNGMTTSCPVEWHFGHGLSYTTFAYSNVRLSATTLSPTVSQTVVTVTVANTGRVNGKEAVLLFVSAPGGPETRLLKKYTKVDLVAGQSTDVSLTLSPDDFGQYVNEIGQGLRKEAASGTYYVSLKSDTPCSAASLGPLCKTFTWNGAPPTTPPPATYYKLRLDAYNFVFTNPASNSVAFVTEATNATSQEWSFDSSTYQIINRGTGRCMDAWQPMNGGGVHTWDCSASNVNQYWNYDAATKQLRHRTHVGYCLDVGATTGTAPHMWQCLPSSHPDLKNQLITLTTPSLNYVVTSPAFNRVLSTVGITSIAFQPLVVASASQLWRWDAQLLRAMGATNKCLDAYQAQNGGAVHLWDCSATNVNQLWTYDASTKQLRHKTHTGYCLDIATPTGESPHLWSCLPANHADIKNQVFILGA
ncbi:hypothetical protein DYB32_007125 [Aphanomyces invadans]|uniref:beta-glucosidase n=1 Tax=Aphanomyces invadans TaxID=157072 RepID=A0A3R6Z0U3_9STRA|nr:hypothetical protein DYB32_007125 [Aphanomyces invadans]